MTRGMRLSPVLSEAKLGFDMHLQTREFVRMRIWHRLLIGSSVAGLLAAALLNATTLEQLTLDDMILKSTAIVHVKVTGSYSASRGADIYTYFQLQTLDTWKGQTATEVAIPGGVANGIRQSVAGAPALKPGQEYVLFLWTSRSGLTQVIGLSQGLFNVSTGSSGTVAQQAPASELMLDQSGLPVQDHPVTMQLQDLRTHVLQTLGAAK
jgi:hypothetical protein